ncbi:MAG TPA: hypothetical protein DDX89_01990, partial [Candidatus Omnitrophica bacterium]|nr:hypothetical protein [Candidatus Omnitrophota bacterium]
MRLQVKVGQVGQVRGGVAVYAAWEGEQRPDRVLPSYAARDRAFIQLVGRCGFRGAANETLMLPKGRSWVVVVGLGKADDLSLDRV